MALYYKSLILSPLLFSYFASICLVSLIEATANGGITIDLIHRDSPLSPYYNSSQSHFYRLRNAFHRSFSRKLSLKSTWSRSKASDQVQSTLTPSPNNGEYLMKFLIGTPPVEQLSIADTGSDLLWMQCEPCTQCYKQTSPLFDPRKTKTYRNLSCGSEQCNAFGSSSCDAENACKYQVSYVDNSYSKGELAVDTVSFVSNSQENVTFPEVVFGCGHEIGGSFGDSTGVIGLSRSSISIINQLNESTGGKFSYCLTFSNSNVSSKINFGTNAIVTGDGVLSTPLVAKSTDTYYSLTLDGISVGEKRLEYKSYSEEESVSEGNIIIDSGTYFTYVPTKFYEGIESSLIRLIEGKRVSDSQGDFKLCYEKPSEGEFKAPPIIAHFKGADLVLQPEKTFVEMEQGILCLTLIPSKDLAIFGNLHQTNYHVGYDIVKQTINFLPTDCTQFQ